MVERDQPAFLRHALKQALSHPDDLASDSMKRVELNALTSPELVTLVEQALTEHGAAAKVVPDAVTIRLEAESSIRASVSIRLKDLLRELVDIDTIAETIAPEIIRDAELPTPEVVRDLIEPARSIDWHRATSMLADRAMKEADDAVIVQAP